MKWVLWILLILTLCAIVAGLAVLASLGAAAPRTRGVERPAEVVTVQRATITLRPTRTAQPARTATAAAPAAPAVTASATALPATVGPSPRPRTATALARRATASAAPTEVATSLPAITGTLSVTATAVVTETALAPSGAITTTATISPSVAVTATAVVTGTTVVPSGAITATATITATMPVTPGETITGTVAAPAATPGAAPSPYPLRTNWTDHAAAGFRVGLPGRWNAVDVTAEGAGGIQDRLVELDGAWVESQREMYSTENLPQGLQFWAMDSRAVGSSHATLTVVTRELTETMTLRELVPQISADLGASRMQILGTRYGLTTNGLDTARMVVRGRVGPITVQQYVYVYLRDNKAWIATYTVDWRYWGSFYPTFAASASSFRAD